MNDRRITLLEATCRVIARHGVRGLRVEEVAKEAGASTTLIYYYFQNRHNLLANAMQFVNDRADRYTGVDDGAGRDQLLAQLLGEFQDNAEVRENSAVWGEFRAAAVFDADLRAVVDETTQRWMSDLTEMIRHGQADGSIPGIVDPESTAVRLTALVEGLSNRWLTTLLTTGGAHKLIGAALERECGTFPVGNRAIGQ